MHAQSTIAAMLGRWKVAGHVFLFVRLWHYIFHLAVHPPSSLFSSSLPLSVPSLPRNISKCRPGAPLPPTSSRVKLQLVFEEVGSDFINASYLGRPPWPQEFIATQVPLQSTVPDFWRSVTPLSCDLYTGKILRDITFVAVSNCPQKFKSLFGLFYF